MRRSDDNWELLARKEPYYAVLTEQRFLSDALSNDAMQAFFATGEADVDSLLRLASRVAGSSFAPKRAIDFGCGVGRLSLALARRCDFVLGVDAAPTMIELAARHREASGVRNAEFLTLPEAQQRAGMFDLAVSLIVFQHIAPRRGYALLDWLLSRVQPGGVAAIHVVAARPGGRLRAAARAIRSRVPWIHDAVRVLRREPLALPYMEMNAYDMTRVRTIFERNGFGPPVVEPLWQAEIEGAIVAAQKR